MNKSTFLILSALVAYFQGMSFCAHASSATTYKLHEQELMQQTGGSSFGPGYSLPDGGFFDQFALVAAIDTAGASLSAAPVLGLGDGNTVPGGTITFPTGPSFAPSWSTGKGYNEYHWGNGSTSQALLNAQYGNGNFTFTLGDATATPTLSLDTVNPVYPISPTLMSGGIWSDGTLLIDPSATTVLTFNSDSFTGYAAATGSATSAAEIKLEFVDSNLMPIFAPSVSQNGLGKSDPALTSYTIAAGSLVAGQTYTFQANYTEYDSVNKTPFTGTGISGSPVGLSGELMSTFITIQAVPEPSSAMLLLCSGLMLLARRRPSVR